jgi:hypothetical protein
MRRRPPAGSKVRCAGCERSETGELTQRMMARLRSLFIVLALLMTAQQASAAPVILKLSFFTSDRSNGAPETDGRVDRYG